LKRGGRGSTGEQALRALTTSSSTRKNQKVESQSNVSDLRGKSRKGRNLVINKSHV